MLTRMSMLMFLTSVSVLLLLYRGYLMVFLDVIIFGVLTLIWSILMEEYISKVSFENRVNHLLIWIHVNVSGFQSFKYELY